MLNIYNYPNPFQSETHFTFNLTGEDLPNEIIIIIFTIAGRLIRDISIPLSNLNFGMNKFHCDGKDQDGDEIENGVYFYKMIVKYNDKTETQINKIAKVK
ncbi:MAG: T9SS type A sorting domain-containing protein [Ignavibacteriales bacterium]|nr:T9SS type A sorting domain-containing protein [Ignavibacteriales bacterium]